MREDLTFIAMLVMIAVSAPFMIKSIDNKRSIPFSECRMESTNRTGKKKGRAPLYETIRVYNCPEGKRYEVSWER